MPERSLLYHYDYDYSYSSCYDNDCCLGVCGGSALNCFCDESCVSFGDCCDDYCAVCGCGGLSNYINAIDCGNSPVLGSTCAFNDTVYTGEGSAPDVAYSFTLLESAPVIISTCGSSFDTFLHLYMDGGDFTYGEEITSCDDCGGCGTKAELELSSLPPGMPLLQQQLSTTTRSGSYLVVVDGYDDACGEYQLQVTCGDDLRTPPPQEC
eukprot:scaffold7944_cov430-Prasinococcus_capsulatus_cf.AAC.3